MSYTYNLITEKRWRLLITGGAGFIGSCMVRKSIEEGHTVLNIDSLTYAACLDNVASVSKSNGYSFEKIDIRDYKNLRKQSSRFNQMQLLILLQNHMLIDR